MNKCAHLNATSFRFRFRFGPALGSVLAWSGNRIRSEPHYVCSGNFFLAPPRAAQQFMHVLPIYKSFLFVCLHLACLLPSVIRCGSVYVCQRGRGRLRGVYVMPALAYVCLAVFLRLWPLSSQSSAYTLWFILIIMLNDFFRGSSFTFMTCALLQALTKLFSCIFPGLQYQ